MISPLEERLDQIRTSPKLQSQHQTAKVLSAVEDTLRDQNTIFTPAAYFSALISLLGQYVSSKGFINKDVATAIVYLLDLVTPHVSPSLLRSKFGPILSNLACVLTFPEAEAPILRPSIGCLESLLIVQDSQAWALPQSQISPRRAISGLLSIASDHRPKVRRRAQDAIANILANPPPSPSLDHPAADMCAEAALRHLKEAITHTHTTSKKSSKDTQSNHNANLIHILQLIKTIANTSSGWPSRKIDPLCEMLLEITKSPNEYLTVISFQVFESLFNGMADEISSTKLPHLLDILIGLQPSETDTQLLPPWIAVLSRGYDVSAQVLTAETIISLPEIFDKVSQFLKSPSHNVRESASECLISFIMNCIPDSIIIEPSIYDIKILEKLAKSTSKLLSLQYQSSWMQVFKVIGALFETLRWRSSSLLPDVLKIIGQLRSTDSFNGKNEADALISQAIRSMGPDHVLEILPLNLLTKSSEQGRVWLLPLMRDSITNTKLNHFKTELVPLSEKFFQLIVENGNSEKTQETKIYETIINQIWATLPGYCDLPIDLSESFDQKFAELLSNLLYQKPEFRSDLSHSLQKLVDSNKLLLSLPDDDESIALLRVSKSDAANNVKHLQGFASNILAVLFNVYIETLPQYRAPILQCINTYLSIMSEIDLVETFSRVLSMLEQSINDVNGQAKKTSEKQNQKPPLSYTLMDIVITISSYLPRSCFVQLFGLATSLLSKNDSSLQKKAYKIIPRLANSETGIQAIHERIDELENLIVQTSEHVVPAARRDRILSMLKIVNYCSTNDLHFIPAILPEVVLCTKETNEKTRNSAFDLLVVMGEKMQKGGTIIQSKVPHMSSDSPSVTASLDEYFTMVSAGLAGSSPHSVTASILALTRILFHFRKSLPFETVSELVQTMDIFLTSPNREIVRAVLGFVKVSIISLPTKIVEPRLQTLIPNLLNWGHEHKAQLQAKVKHIIERAIRRFGVEKIESLTPESDRKLINNIRKTRERKKKKKSSNDKDSDDDDDAGQPNGKKFGNSLDQTIYGSDEDSQSGSDMSDDEVLGKSRNKKETRGTYIVEDEDEPLDLLDKKILGRISSTLPLKRVKVTPKKRKAQVDEDGKLIFTENKIKEQDNSTQDSGINAYVEAVKGSHAPQIGQKGKLKFKQNRSRDNDDDDADEVDVMEIDGNAVKGSDFRNARKKTQFQKNPRGKFQGKGGSRNPKAGMKNARSQRRGLGQEKTRGGRIMKGGNKF